MDSAGIMSNTNCDTDKMLDVYIHDYLLKRKLHATAKSFEIEGKVPKDSPTIDAPGGFLFEWWSVFWDIFITRIDTQHSEAAASYIEVVKALKLKMQQEQYFQKIQQNQQMQMQQLVQQRRAQQQQAYQQQVLRRQLKRPRYSSNLIRNTANSIVMNDSLDRQILETTDSNYNTTSKAYEERAELPLQRDEFTDMLLKQRLVQKVNLRPEPSYGSMYGAAALGAQSPSQISHGLPPDNSMNQSQQLPGAQNLEDGMKSMVNPMSRRTERSLMGTTGSNQGADNLSLKGGWDLTGWNQLRPGTLHQPMSLTQQPPAYNQFQLQHQPILQPPQCLGIRSARDVTCTSSRVPYSNTSMTIGKNNQLNFISTSNVSVLPRVDADTLIESQEQQLNTDKQEELLQHSVSSEISPNSNYQPPQQDKHSSHGIINADDLTSTNFQADNKMDVDHFMNDGTLDEVESFLSPDETDFGDKVGLSSDVNKGLELKEMHLIPASCKVVCCRFSSDGKLLAIGGHDKKATVWCTKLFTLKSTLEEHSKWITDVSFSPRTLNIATSSDDRTVKVWDVDNPGKSLRTFIGHSTGVTSVDFHPSKDDLICSCDIISEIRYWSIKSGSCVGIFKGGATQLRFQPNNGRILAVAGGNCVSIIDVETQACRLKFQGKNHIHSVCWHSSGEYLASISENVAKVWKVDSGGKGDCIRELNSNVKKFQACAFHPTRPSLLIIGSCEKLELWDMAENKTTTLDAHDQLVSALAVSNVTGLVASASDKCVKLWH